MDTLGIVAIDSGDFIRRGMRGSFRACTGVAITIPDVAAFNSAYSDNLDKCCDKYGVERKREVYKSYDIMSSLRFRESLNFLSDFFDQMVSHISEIDFYYTYLFSNKVPLVKLYGAERSGVEQIKPVEFIKKLSPSYPHCCAWKYIADHSGKIDGSKLQLDHFEGEVTFGWEVIKDLDFTVFFAGDEMHPCLAVADIIVKLLDQRLYVHKKGLLLQDINYCFSEQEEIIVPKYIGQKYLGYITPIKKQWIDVTSKLARPLIFILKEQPPLRMKDESAMIRESPLWNKICDFAYEKGGTVKFVDLNKKQDRRLLREGGFAICLGEKSKKTAEYFQNLGIPIEIMMSSELIKV